MYWYDGKRRNAKEFDTAPPMVIAGDRTDQMVRVLLPDGTVACLSIGSATAEELVLRLGFNPYEVILSRGGCMITEDTLVSDCDEIRVTAVVHGG
jgi:sulfur carrier protein ThiS